MMVVAGFPEKEAVKILGLFFTTDDKHFIEWEFIKRPTPPTDAPVEFLVAEDVIKVKSSDTLVKSTSAS